MDMKELSMLDINAPDTVQVQVSGDGKTLWVNVDGICRLRCCRIQHLEIDTPSSIPAAARMLEKVIQAWMTFPGSPKMLPVINEAREFPNTGRIT